MITIDTREQKLLALLGFTTFTNDTSSIDYNGIKVSIAALPLGDIVLQKETSLIIERKTVSDLVCSIQDGRYREQKNRLLQHYHPNRIVYLIENFIEPLPSVHYKKILGSLVNMQLEYGITVLCSFNLSQTLDYILDLHSKLDVKTRSETGTGSGSSSGFGLSKSQYNSQFPTENCLMTIKGVSFNVAKCIAAKYPSIEKLVHAFDTCPIDTRPFLLADLKSSNSNRKLGKSLSQRIYTTLYGSTVN